MACCDVTKEMLDDKEKTLGDYYKRASDLLIEADSNKDNEESCEKNKNLVWIIASNNIMYTLCCYAGNRNC